jgi:hypothetical protein
MAEPGSISLLANNRLQIFIPLLVGLTPGLFALSSRQLELCVPFSSCLLVGFQSVFSPKNPDKKRDSTIKLSPYDI